MIVYFANILTLVEKYTIYGIIINIELLLNYKIETILKMLEVKNVTIDTYRNNIARKRSELSKLSSDKAKESDKKARQKQKIVSAIQQVHFQRN
mgnify:CR=1 FL=1